MIDEFTIIEQGRELLTMEADDARGRFQKLRARFAAPVDDLDVVGALGVRWTGREVEVLADGNSQKLMEQLRARSPEDLRCDSLTLEEVFIAAGTLAKVTL